MLRASSNNTNNIDFKYKVVIVLPAVPDRTLFISPRPTDSNLELDLQTHLRDYLDYDNFILPTGFNFTAAPHVEYSLQISETWKDSPLGQVTLIAGLKATNILLDRQEWLQFDPARWQIDPDGLGATGELLINKPLGVPMFKDEYYHIHVVGIPDNTFMFAFIQQYDAGGLPVFPTYSNAAGASTVFADAKFMRLDLSTMTFNPVATRIGIVIKDGLGNNLTVEKLFDVEDYDCTQYERWKLFYMDRLGSYNNISLDLISSSSMTMTPKTFRKRIDPLTDSSKKRAVTRYTQRKSEKFLLNTDYLTEVQAATLEDLLESPRVYRDVRNIDGWGATDFLPVEVLTKTLERYSYGKNDLPQYPIEVRYSHETMARHE
jgi:hypothetical protein